MTSTLNCSFKSYGSLDDYCVGQILKHVRPDRLPLMQALNKRHYALVNAIQTNPRLSNGHTVIHVLPGVGTLSAALTACTSVNVDVVLQKGTYFILGELNISQNSVRMFGRGSDSTLLVSSAAMLHNHFVIIASRDRIELHDLAIIAKGDCCCKSGVRSFAKETLINNCVFNTTNVGINGIGERIYITNSVFDVNGGKYGVTLIYAVHVKNCVIENNIFRNALNSHVQIPENRDIHIRDNVFESGACGVYRHYTSIDLGRDVGVASCENNRFVNVMMPFMSGNPSASYLKYKQS